MRFWWRVALHCGLPHPDFLLAVLSYRQQREMEIYSRIEPIGAMTGVSEPPKREGPAEADEPSALPSFDDVVKMLL